MLSNAPFAGRDMTIARPDFRKPFFLVAALMAAAVVPVDLMATVYTIAVDGSVRQGSVPHYWSTCVGTGTMWFCQKPAWRTAAKIGVAEAGFKMVRGHGTLMGIDDSDHIGIFHWPDTTKPPTYTWTTLDSIYDFIIDTCNMAPLVELNFMPKDLQKSTNIGKPKSWNKWRDLVDSFVTHCEVRYGKPAVESWFFEVWNEYDYSGFWTGTAADYDTLYTYAAVGALAADSLIRIGGPVADNNGDLQPFVTYCADNNVKYSFLSNHQYGCEATSDTADPAAIQTDNEARSNVIKSSGKTLFNINSEYNSSYSGQGGNTVLNCISMDSHVNAPFITKSIKLILDDYTAGTYQLPDVLSYWTISDCFNESGTGGGQSYIENHKDIPFAEVFGLINYQGIRKAAFNAYKMLNLMGTTRLSLTGGTTGDGVDGFAAMNGDSSVVTVMVYDYYSNMKATSADNTVYLTFSNIPLPRGNLTVTHYRVDSLHSNPYAVWEKQGKPATPTTAQWDSMQAAQNLALLMPAASFNYTGTAFTDTFSMPRYSVSLLVFQAAGSSSIKATHAVGSGSGLKITGTTISSRLQGSPLSIAVYTPGGRLVRRINTPQRSIDLRRYLPPGAFIVYAKVQGERMTGRMVVKE
jgi:xylan 1,4-beta-xylosidase